MTEKFTNPDKTMVLYSSATHSMDTGNIDVSLHLTEWQAYEALANDIMPWDEDGAGNLEQVARFEALKALLHTEGVTREIVALFNAALDEQEMIGTVRKHDYPWTFPETMPGTELPLPAIC